MSCNYASIGGRVRPADQCVLEYVNATDVIIASKVECKPSGDGVTFRVGTSCRNLEKKEWGLATGYTVDHFECQANSACDSICLIDEQGDGQPTIFGVCATTNVLQSSFLVFTAPCNANNQTISSYYAKGGDNCDGSPTVISYSDCSDKCADEPDSGARKPGLNLSGLVIMLLALFVISTVM